MPLDQAVYVPAVGARAAFIAGVRGGYIFKLDPTTGAKISSTQYAPISQGKASVVYDSVTDRIFSFFGADPTPVTNVTALLPTVAGIYKIDPANFSSHTFDDTTGWETWFNNMGPGNMIGLSGLGIGIQAQLICEPGTIYGVLFGTDPSSYNSVPFKYDGNSGAGIVQTGYNLYQTNWWALAIVGNYVAYGGHILGNEIDSFDKTTAHFTNATSQGAVNPNWGIAYAAATTEIWVTHRKAFVTYWTNLTTVGGTVALPAGSSPLTLRYNPNDGLLYVADMINNSVHIINPTTHAYVTTKTGFDSPIDFVFSPTKQFAVQNGSTGLKVIT